MGKVFFRITLFVLFAVPFLTGACNSDDYVIDANGIRTDSSTIYVPYTGAMNKLTLSSFKEWWVESEHPSQGTWLTVSPEEGDFSSEIQLTATQNEYRRRSVTLLFNNPYMTDTVVVIQRAPQYYEPGTVLYFEDFGSTPVAETVLGGFAGWSGRGTWVGGSSPSGSDAFVQSTIRSSDYINQPHEIISGGNSLKLNSGGWFTLPTLSRGSSTFEAVIFTFYVAAYDGGYQPMEGGAIVVQGSTSNVDDSFQNINLTTTRIAGWQKIEAEFKTQLEGSNFYLRIRNEGTNTIYIDDITLESGGLGTDVIGVPAPTVTTNPATDIAADSARMNGIYILPASIPAVDKAGFHWWHYDEENPQLQDYEEIEIPGTEPNEAFSYLLENLERGETYKFRAFTVHDGDVYTYGTERDIVMPKDEEEDENS